MNGAGGGDAGAIAGKASVAVIVPVFNRAAEIVRTLDALAAQTRPPDRLVIVDDGSTDATADTVERWLAAQSLSFPATLLRIKTNGGVSRARNAGWRECSGADLLAFLDSDDVWPPDFLQRTCAALETNSDAVAAVTDRLMASEGGAWQRCDRLEDLAADPLHWFYCNGAGVLSCSLIRAASAARVGAFDPALPTGQDAAFLLRLSMEAPWVHVPGAPVTIYRDPGGARAGAGNLSARYPDSRARWAAIYTDFHRDLMSTQPRPDAARRRQLTRFLARLWEAAARQHRDAGRIGDALACLGRAWAWRLRAAAQRRNNPTY